MPGEKMAIFLKTAKAEVSKSINQGGILAMKSGITVFPNNVPSRLGAFLFRHSRGHLTPGGCPGSGAAFWIVLFLGACRILMLLTYDILTAVSPFSLDKTIQDWQKGG